MSLATALTRSAGKSRSVASLDLQLRSRRKVPWGVVEDPDAAEDRSEACLRVQGHQGGLKAALQTQHLAGSAATGWQSMFANVC